MPVLSLRALWNHANGRWTWRVPTRSVGIPADASVPLVSIATVIAMGVRSMGNTFALALVLNVMAPIFASAALLDVGESRIYVETSGQGPPVVFLHDGLLHSEVWDGQREAFSREYSFVRYDRRGYGRSDAPTAPFSNEDDLLKVLDANSIDRAVLVGASSGGGLAINFTLNHPDRVSALVLVGAVVDGLGFSDHFRRRELTAYGADKGRIERFATDPWMVGVYDPKVRDRVRDLLKSYPNDLSVEKHQLAAAYAIQNPPPTTALRRLGEIRVPTLIVTGSADIPDVHVHAGALESGIQGARREIMTGTGHLSYLEDPEGFNGLVLNFLSLVSIGRNVDRGFAPAGGTYLYYESAGTGAPLVLLNAGLLDHRMWDDQFDAFSTRFRVIRYDTQSTGLSKNLSAYSNAEDLRELLDHLGVKSAHLVGLSGGARAAIDFALLYPSRVNRLVLASPGLGGYEFKGDDLMEHSAELQAAFAAGDTSRAVELFQRQWTDGHRDRSLVDSKVRERVRLMAMANAQPGRFMGWPGDVEPRALSRLAEVRAPTLVITGALDLTDIHAIAAMLTEQVENVQAVDIPNTAHMVNMEKPAEFNQIVLDFLLQH